MKTSLIVVLLLVGCAAPPSPPIPKPASTPPVRETIPYPPNWLGKWKLDSPHDKPYLELKEVIPTTLPKVYERISDEWVESNFQSKWLEILDTEPDSGRCYFTFERGIHGRRGTSPLLVEIHKEWLVDDKYLIRQNFEREGFWRPMGESVPLGIPKYSIFLPISFLPPMPLFENHHIANIDRVGSKLSISFPIDEKDTITLIKERD